VTSTNGLIQTVVALHQLVQADSAIFTSIESDGGARR